MQTANIYITNFCNQNCPFCFARTEMNDKTVKREMALPLFKQTLARLKKHTKIEVVKLLGGEPTLHSHFTDIIDYSLEHFPRVQIFTNALIPPKILEYLLVNGARIGYTFNLSTPGFTGNGTIRKIIEENVSRLQKVSGSTISLTLHPGTDIRAITQGIPDVIIQNAGTVRLGLANPIAGTRNTYGFSSFPAMGGLIVRLIAYLKARNPKLSFFLNCGFTRCMFTDEEYLFVKERVTEGRLYFSCHGKDGTMEINAGGDMFHCFSLSSQTKHSTKKSPIIKTQASIVMQRLGSWFQKRKNVCVKCPHYGIEGDKCPGPCLAFLINEVNNRSC